MRPGEIARSLLFYGVFYAGTLVFVLLALGTVIVGSGPLRGIVRNWSRFHRLCVTGILDIRIRIEGALPTEGVLIAMKHESFFEAIDMPALIDNPAIFAKAELFRIPLWGRAAKIYGLIPVEREQGASALRRMMNAARACVAKGRILAIFPEGTRVPHGSPAPLQSGFAGVYKLLRLPVVPIAIDSGPLYHRRWKRRGTISIRVGELIEPGLPRAEIEARVSAAINALNNAEAYAKVTETD